MTLQGFKERIGFVFKSQEQLEQEADVFDSKSKGALKVRDIAIAQLAGSYTDQATTNDISTYQSISDQHHARAERYRRAAAMSGIRRIKRLFVA